MFEKGSYIVSIDLGCSNIVIAAACVDNDGKLDLIDLVSRPSKGMSYSGVTNIDQITALLSETVAEFEQKNGLKIDEAYIGISDKNLNFGCKSCYVFVGNDGEIRESDVDKLNENMRNVQAPDGCVILDRFPQIYTINSSEQTLDPIGMFGQRLEATFGFVVAGRSSMDRLTKVFERVGIRPKYVFANALASANAVLIDDEKEYGAAAVDIGGGTTDVCIWQGNVVRYAASIPLGADAINRDIKTMAIPDAQIETLKRRCGYATASAIPEANLNQVIKVPGRSSRDTKTTSFRNLSTVIEARMLQIIEFVAGEIKRSGFADRLNQGIVLTGGGSLLRGVDTLFHERTGYEIKLAFPENMLTDNHRELTDDPEAATAIGLLIMGLKSEQGSVVKSVKAESKQPTTVHRPDTVHTVAKPVQHIEQEPKKATTGGAEQQWQGEADDADRGDYDPYLDEEGADDSARPKFWKSIFGSKKSRQIRDEENDAAEGGDYDDRQTESDDSHDDDDDRNYDDGQPQKSRRSFKDKIQDAFDGIFGVVNDDDDIQM